MVYNMRDMRILITPLIRKPKADASYYLTRNLAALFRQENHQVAISASRDNAFRYASLYECPSLHRPLLHFHTGRSYEEWLYANGASTKEYLLDDIHTISEIVDSFHPDLIITMDRIAAIMVSELRHIRCWAIVNSAMYRKTYFPASVLKDTNAVLEAFHLDQVFDLPSLYALCERRIGFGPIEVQPFIEDNQVTRIGLQSVYPLHATRTNRVCVFIPDVRKNAHALNKIITEAFLGAPYSVYVWYEGCHPSHIDNIHFLAKPKPELMPGSIAVIHDGNDYLCNACMSRGILQVMIVNHECIRSYEAQAAERNMFGLAIHEENLTMAKLYETYRTLLSDDSYYQHTEKIRKLINELPDLTDILRFL